MYIVFVAPALIMAWFVLMSRSWAKHGEPEALLRIIALFRTGLAVGGVLVLGLGLASVPGDDPGGFLVFLAGIALFFVVFYFIVGVWLGIVLHCMMRRLFREGVVVGDRAVCRRVRRRIKAYRWLHAAISRFSEVSHESVLNSVCPRDDKEKPDAMAARGHAD